MNLKTAAPSLEDDHAVARSTTTAEDGSAAATAAARAELAAFVGEHYDRLLRLAWLVCRDSADAADAVQTALELAWRRRETLRDVSSLRPWLDRIVVRAAGRAAHKRQSWLARLVSPRPELAWVEPVGHPVPQHEELLALRAALARLSPDHRAVVALHLHAGYSVAETAEIVGAPLETVRSRLRVARERLRRDLAEAER